MIKLIIIGMLIFIVQDMGAQTIIKSGLSPQEVYDLQHALKKNTTDTARIDILLQLAEFNLDKGGDEKPNLDSASVFIRNAKEINTRQQLQGNRNGLILFYEACLARKNSHIDSAIQLAKKASADLQSHHDEYNLARTYLELSCCYDSKNPNQATAKKNVFNALFQHVPVMLNHEQLEKYELELVSFYNLQLRNENHSIKLDFLGHLVRVFTLQNNKLNEFWARKEMADIHYQQGKLDEAINELLQIAKEQKAGDYPQICFTYDLLSGLYLYSTDFKKALAYSLETVKSVKSATDSAYLPNFYSRVAVNYSTTGSADEAVSWNLKRLNYLIATGQTNNIYSTINNLTSDLINLKRPVEALNMIRDKVKIVVPSTNWEKEACFYVFLNAIQHYITMPWQKSMRRN